MDSELINYINS